MKRLMVSAFLVGAFFTLFGFKLENAIVPKEDIMSGGPPKDGIPAILEPQYIRPEEVNFLEANDRVIGVNLGGQARAYPIKIMNWHEVVNTEVDKIPIVVTF